MVHAFIAFRVADEEAVEDLFQESFIKVMHTLQRGGYTSEGKFRQWLMRLVHNMVMDYFRKEKALGRYQPTREPEVADGYLSLLPTEEMNAEELMIEADTIEGLYRRLSLLPAEQREVVEMRYWQDLTFKEIAEQTGVSINTALGRMRYALNNLRKAAVD